LFKESIRFVSRCLGSFAGGTGIAEVLNEGTKVQRYKGTKVGPYIVTSNELKGFVLSVMSGQDVIMFVL
jgi:hypothetical protein